jgi:hypothetical protein
MKRALGKFLHITVQGTVPNFIQDIQKVHSVSDFKLKPMEKYVAAVTSLNTRRGTGTKTDVAYTGCERY